MADGFLLWDSPNKSTLMGRTRCPSYPWLDLEKATAFWRLVGYGSVTSSGPGSSDGVYFSALAFRFCRDRDASSTHGSVGSLTAGSNSTPEASESSAFSRCLLCSAFSCACRIIASKSCRL